jgi:hypothetical protein
MMSRRRLIVQRIASLASRLRFGVRRSSSVFVAGAARSGSKAVLKVRRNACVVQWARCSQYSGGRWWCSCVQTILGCCEYLMQCPKSQLPRPAEASSLSGRLSLRIPASAEQNSPAPAQHVLKPAATAGKKANDNQETLEANARQRAASSKRARAQETQNCSPPSACALGNGRPVRGARPVARAI